MKALALLICIFASWTTYSAWADSVEDLATLNKGDYAAAIAKYIPLAQKGNAKAQYNLGVIYSNGLGVNLNYVEAVRWYRLAAEQGIPQAQSNLGVMFANGRGVPNSQVVAYALLSLATVNLTTVETMADYNRTMLANDMTTQEIEAAKTLTQEMAKPGNLLNALDQYVHRHARY